MDIKKKAESMRKGQKGQHRTIHRVIGFSEIGGFAVWKCLKCGHIFQQGHKSNTKLGTETGKECLNRDCEVKP